MKGLNRLWPEWFWYEEFVILYCDSFEVMQVISNAPKVVHDLKGFLFQLGEAMRNAFPRCLALFICCCHSDKYFWCNWLQFGGMIILDVSAGLATRTPDIVPMMGLTPELYYVGGSWICHLSHKWSACSIFAAGWRELQLLPWHSSGVQCLLVQRSPGYILYTLYCYFLSHRIQCLQKG